MKTEVQWLAYYLAEEEILSRSHCQILSKRLPQDIEAEEFGRALIDYNLCSDQARIEVLQEQAKLKGRGSEEPPYNPFLSEAELPAAVAATEAAVAKPTLKLASQDNAANRTVNTPPPPPPPARPATPPPAPAAETARPATPAPSRIASPPQRSAVPTFAYPTSTDMPSLDGPFADPASAGQVLAQALVACQHKGISDLHLSAGSRPFGRKDRQIVFLSEKALDPDSARSINTALLNEEQRERFKQQHDLDFALPLSERARFRVNLMEHKEGVAGTYRVVADQARSLQELGFAATAQMENLLDYHNGLVLVTGPAGSGKSTTLAALVQYMNQHRTDHIISVEEPIEVVHRSASCQITQRDVGTHTRSFQSALKGALRQDPDIIVIGEMRDLATIEMAISASETGHLVIGTMHTSNAATTLNRLLDVFPAAQQPQIRAMVSESLRGIICQRLLPAVPEGVALASELLLSNVAVKNLIRENKIDGLSNVIETGAAQGMVLMDRSIMKLYQEGRISAATARENLASDLLKNQIPA